VITDVDAARRAAVTRVADAVSLDELTALQTELLGRRSALSGLKQRLGSLDPSERKAAGQAVNDAFAAVEASVAERRAALAAAARQARLEAERLDLTETLDAYRPRRGHLHLVTQTHESLEDVFVGLGFTVAEGPEVESDWYNFTALNMPPHHPARSEFDTMFVNLGEPGSVVLRTHTSPVQIRTMETQKPPLYIVSMGTCFRRDTPDATHMPVFHQIEGLVVDHGITFPDLAGTIEAFTHAYFGPGYSSRLRPSYFPFTEPSAEFDIQRPDGTWLELGGCGMVHPNVFRNCGVDPEEWTGFAFGFGTDRMPMMRHCIDDLRELFTNDVRFLEQF
jgi:phenylalanyl-tRNA synthetase alpha chain